MKELQLKPTRTKKTLKLKLPFHLQDWHGYHLLKRDKCHDMAEELINGPWFMQFSMVVHWRKNSIEKYIQYIQKIRLLLTCTFQFYREIPRVLWEVSIKVNTKKKEFVTPKSCIFYSRKTWSDHCSLQKTSENASSKRKWRRIQHDQTQLSSRSCITASE